MSNLTDNDDTTDYSDETEPEEIKPEETNNILIMHKLFNQIYYNFITDIYNIPSTPHNISKKYYVYHPIHIDNNFMNRSLYYASSSNNTYDSFFDEFDICETSTESFPMTYVNKLKQAVNNYKKVSCIQQKTNNIIDNVHKYIFADEAEAKEQEQLNKQLLATKD